MKTKKSPSNTKQTSALFKRTLLSAMLALLIAATFWTQEANTEIRIPEAGKAAELYANQIDDDLLHTYAQAIDKAESSVLLIVYSLTDPHIISCLRKKSEQGMDIKVICDAKASPYISTKLGPKVNSVRRLGPGLMHQKILVIDHKQTWIGSANMTSESLCLHGNLIAAVESAAMSAEVHAKAETLNEEGRGAPFPKKEFSIGGQSIELWFLPDNAGAVSKLISLIDSAQKTVRVAMFTWTRQDLAYAVVAAAKRGVKAEVVIDHYSGKGASSKIVKLLKKNGISVALSKGGPLLHHKFLYIDSSVLVNGSANWTKAAFTQNDDCFIVMHDLNDAQKKRMEEVWSAVHESSVPVK